MKVLVVDDDDGVLEVVQVFLEEQGINRIASFRNGKNVMKAVVDMQPDLVLLDIMLPDIDGVSLLKKLIGVYQTMYVMMTAYKDAEKVLEAIRIGATDVLLKPINWDYLKVLISRADEARMDREAKIEEGGGR